MFKEKDGHNDMKQVRIFTSGSEFGKSSQMKEVGHITAGKCRLSKECSIILLRIVESVIAKWKSANPSLTVNDQNKQLWCLVQKKNGRPQLGHVDTGNDDTRFLQIMVPLNVHMQSKLETGGAGYFASTEWLKINDEREVSIDCGDIWLAGSHQFVTAGLG